MLPHGFSKKYVIKRNYATNLCLAPPAVLDEGRKIVGIPRHRHTLTHFKNFQDLQNPTTKTPVVRNWENDVLLIGRSLLGGRHGKSFCVWYIK